MTFHTFEAGTFLIGRTFKKINEKFKEYGSLYFKSRRNSDRKIFLGLEGHGIIIYLYKRSTDDDRFVFTICYRVNPTRIYNSADKLNVFHANDTENLVSDINRLLYSVSDYLPPIEICSLSRFDFTSNIIMGSPEAVSECISLVNRTFIPRKDFRQKMTIDCAGRPTFPKEEATFTHRDYCEVSLYNKMHQIETEKLGTDLKCNILRVEIRCENRYLRNLMIKFGVSGIEEFLSCLPEIGTYAFSSQLRKLGLIGKYRHLREICDEVDNTNYHNETKRRIIELVSAAASGRSIVKAMGLFDEPVALDTIVRLKKLDSLPLPLPYRSTLPSGFDLLEECLRFADEKIV